MCYPVAMQIRYIKIRPERYRLECTRQNGSKTSAELETRSFLIHDLMHFVVENRASLSDSFYGPIARGKELVDVTPKTMREEGASLGEEAQTTEIVVATLQSKGDTSPKARQIGISEYLALSGLPLPEYLTSEWCEEVMNEHRELMRRWNNMRIGGEIALQWKE
jgi:hypothetical protein